MKNFKDIFVNDADTYFEKVPAIYEKFLSHVKKGAIPIVVKRLMGAPYFCKYDIVGCWLFISVTMPTNVS
ncbi:hypothetical protein Bcoa_2321 [Heyndrickxia coagulans 36D1]|uniref:Uncharacterized protein n=2 Tax=Heyndrickxia coagulans TaxID=1398 RepID=G2TKK9_HEYCO|nr:hypothetical protein Bcoa_2321 [Heyndrickxia coagulans 36D1]KWZ76960.1 hypothetical protein HMPREF3213_03562 [Heyndrickxia coagulans]